MALKVSTGLETRRFLTRKCSKRACQELHIQAAPRIIQKAFVEHLLQIARRAVCWGGLGNTEIDERQGGPCPETACLVEQTDGQMDS